MQYQIFRGGDGEFYWRLVDGSETIAASNDGHKTRQECRDEIARVKQSRNAEVVNTDR